MPLSIFVIPYTIQYLQSTFKLKPKNRILDMTVGTAVSMFSLWVGMTFGYAAFPQISKVTPDRLEPEFQNLVNSKGNRIKQYYFNRGL